MPITIYSVITMSLITTDITNDTSHSKTRPYPTAVGERRDTFSAKVRETLGTTATLMPATSVNLDMRRGAPHSTTGIPYAIGGTATVVSQKVGLWLAGFDDPIKAILGVGVHKDEKIIIKRKFCVGGGATIVPERAPARTVAIQEDVREVTLVRYGGDIEMNLNLFLTDEAEEELNMKVDCQKRELEKQLVKIGYDTLMTEGTLIMDAIMRSSPSYQNSVEPNKYAAHAQQIYSKQIFGAINKYRFPIANLLAAAKYASAYTIAQQKGSVMIIPHGVPELTTIARKEKMEYQVSGLQNNTKINMELDNVYTDPNSGVRILVHHPTPSYANGAAAPTIDLASANLSDTSYVITKHQRPPQENEEFFKKHASCRNYLQNTVQKSLGEAIVTAQNDLTDTDYMQLFRNQLKRAACQVTEGLKGFNGSYARTLLENVSWADFNVDSADVDDSFEAMSKATKITATRTEVAVLPVAEYDPTPTGYDSGVELDAVLAAFEKALARKELDSEDAANVSALDKVGAIIACCAAAYTVDPSSDLKEAFAGLQKFACFVKDMLPPDGATDPMTAILGHSGTLAAAGDDKVVSGDNTKKILYSYIITQMAKGEYKNANLVRGSIKTSLSQLQTNFGQWAADLKAHYDGKGDSKKPDKDTEIDAILNIVTKLTDILQYILATATGGLTRKSQVTSLLDMPDNAACKPRAVRVWNYFESNAGSMAATVTFNANNPESCVETLTQSHVQVNTGFMQIPDIEAGGLKPFAANTVIRVAEVIASSAILAAPGDSTGQLLVGYPFTGVSTSATEERMRVQLRCYLGAALYQPDAVMILPNVFVEGINKCAYYSLPRVEHGIIIEQMICQMQLRASVFADRKKTEAFKTKLDTAWGGQEQLLECAKALIDLFLKNRLPMFPQTTNRAVIPDGTVYEGTSRVVSNAGEFGILDDPVKYIGLHGVPQAYEHGEF